jgi:protein CpxP
MSTPTRNKNLVFVIAVLLLTNIAVLAYFLWFKDDKSKHQDKNRPGFMIEALQKEVGFTDQQIEAYKKLKEEQKETVRPLFDEMRKAKENLFKLLSDSLVTDSVLQQSADKIAEQQKNIEIQALQHFRKVRALCNSPEQREKYDSAVLRMMRKMGKVPRKSEESKEEEKK